MPPHNIVALTRPRSLANVLADMKEAKRDYSDALAATRNAADGMAVEEADDRATEAEVRLADLQAEFDVRLAEATGITVEDFRAAYSEALI